MNDELGDLTVLKAIYVLECQSVTRRLLCASSADGGSFSSILRGLWSHNHHNPPCNGVKRGTHADCPILRGQPSAMLEESCPWNEGGPGVPFALRLLVSALPAILGSQKTSILAALGWKRVRGIENKGQPSHLPLLGYAIAAPRLAHTSVPAVSTSKAIATTPHSETAGTGPCSETLATRNPRSRNRKSGQR